MAKVLVTGAAGFIGSHTVDLLLEKGHAVLGVDNFRTGKRENLQKAEGHSGFNLEKADICNAEGLTALVQSFRPDSIIHLAALVSVVESVENPDLNFAINIQGTHNVAEAARSCGVKRIAFASSAAIYGEPETLPLAEDASKAPASPYGMAKLASEELLLSYARCYGIEAVCLRYFNIYGPRQDPGSPYSGVISVFWKRMQEGLGVTVYGDGKQSRDFVSVFDVARANTAAGTDDQIPSGAYNICTGQQITLLDLIEAIGKIHPGNPATQFAPERHGDIRHSCGSPENASAVMHFTATTPLVDGLQTLL